MPQINLGKNRFYKTLKVVEHIAEVAQAYTDVRDKPTIVDWLAFGVRCANIAYQARGEVLDASKQCAWDFLENNSDTWKSAADIGPIIMSYVVEAQVVPEYWNGDPDFHMLVAGKIGQEDIRWVQEGVKSTPTKGPYLRIDREREVMAAVGVRVWQELGTRNACYSRGQITADVLAEKSGVQTEESAQLYQRILAFYQAGDPHSCLLVGPPGAGKSTAIRQVAARLGLRTLKVSVSSLKQEDGGAGLKTVASTTGQIDGIRAVIRILQPDLVVLEDLDRLLNGGSDLLDLLEVARLNSRIILASANGTEDMMGALLRPGRFDDVLRYEGLDENLVRDLAGGEEGIVERLRVLPLVYAYEYAKRRRVLGPETALFELTELEERAARCAQEDMIYE